MKEVKKETITTETTPVEPTESVAERPAFTRTSKAPLVISLIAAGIMLLLGLGALGISALFIAHRREAAASINRPEFDQQRPGRMFGTHERFARGTVMRGVVTAVSGDSFTLAGNGTTKTIKTSSATTYTGDKTSVSVNDSVAVEYTGSGDSLTATVVRIINAN